MDSLYTQYKETYKALIKQAAISLDIKVGDILLGGRYKNKRTEVKKIGKDDYGHPTINGKSLLNFYIEKLLPEKRKSRKTRDANKGT